MILNKYKKSIIFLVIILAGLAVYFIGFNNSNNNSVVYLSTGEVYIGKLSTFPQLKLTDIYLLQVTKDKNDPTKSNFQLTPIKKAIWAPKYLYLNKDQVIFYGPIKKSSRISEALSKQK